MTSFATAGLALILLIGLSAAAPGPDDAEQRQDCTAHIGEGVSPARKITACSVLLDAGQLSIDDQILFLGNRGDGYFNTGQNADAIRDYDNVLTLAKDQPDDDFIGQILGHRGFAYFNLQRYGAALRDFNRALAAKPDFGQALLGRGQAFRMMGFDARGVQDFDRAIALQPDFVEAYIERGIAADDIGDTPHSLQALDYALLLNAQSMAAYYNRGITHVHEGRYALAVQDFDRALALTAASPDGGDLRDFTGSPAAARDHAKAYIDAMAARAAETQLPVAGTGDAAGVAPASADVPSRAVGLTHDCVLLYPGMSQRLFEGGNVRVNYAVDEAGSIAHVELLQSSGSERLDRAAIACVSNLWRNTPAMRNGIAVASPDHRAMIQFQMDHAMGTHDIDVRAIAHAALGDYDAALADSDRAIALDPETQEYRYHRGLIEYVMGRLGPAIADFDEAIRLQPDFQNASDARDLAKAEALDQLPAHGAGHSI
jgi:TonB family protein